MRNLILALACALLGAFALSGHASAQGVTRVCTQVIGANGSNNCTDVSPTNPFPVTQSGQSVKTALGYCQLSVTTAVQTSTCSGGIPTGTTWSLICNEGAAARWRDDGITPTTTVGNPFGIGTAATPVCFNYFAAFSALQWVAQSGTSVLDFAFYK